MARREVVLTLILLVLFSAWLRFNAFAHRMVTDDEVDTLIRSAGWCSDDKMETLRRVSGSGGRDFRRSLSEGAFAGSAEIQRLLLVESPPLRVMTSAVANCSPHGSLAQYGILWLAKRVGIHSVTAFRSIGLIWLLLLVVATYSLTLRIFRSQNGALIAAALIATSPHLTRAVQEMRQYPLFALTAVLASVALIRAIERGDRRGWITYALIVALNLYATHLSLLLLPAHVLAVLASGRCTRRVFASFAASIGGALLLYLPAAVMLFHGREIVWRKTRWFRVAPEELFGAVVRVYAEVRWFTSYLIRTVGSPSRPVVEELRLLLWIVLACAVVWAVRRRGESRFAVLPIATFVIWVGGLAIIDLMTGAQMLRVDRYHTPAFLNLLIIIGGISGWALDRPGWMPRIVGGGVAAALCLLQLFAHVHGPRQVERYDRLREPARLMNAGVKSGIGSTFHMPSKFPAGKIPSAIASIALALESNIPIVTTPISPASNSQALALDGGFGAANPMPGCRMVWSWRWGQRNMPHPGNLLKLYECGETR